MKKLTAVILLTALLASLCLSCPAAAETADSGESKALDYLAHELEASSEHLMITGANVNMAYDNLPIKAYIYPWSQVQLVHDLSKRVPTVGGEAAVCPEDGFTLLDVVR